MDGATATDVAKEEATTLEGPAVEDAKEDGLHTRHLLESTHTNTNKHTARPDKVRCGLTPWRRPPKYGPAIF